MRARSLVLIIAVVALVLWLSDGTVPGWLAVLVVVSALALEHFNQRRRRPRAR